MIDECGYTTESDGERKGEAEGEALRAQQDNLREGCESWDGSEHDGGNTGSYALLGPEQEAVIADEKEHRHCEAADPLPTSGRWFAADKHEEVEHTSGNEEADPGTEKRRNLLHADSDRKEGGSPNKIDDAKGGYCFPSG